MTTEDVPGETLAKTASNATSHRSSRHSHHGHHDHHDHHGHHGHHNHSDAQAAHSKQNASAAAIEYGYPHGHLGFLTAEETTAFNEFKALLTKEGLFKPGPPASHDDPTLLRFIRARRWIVQDAYKQFKDTEDWRAANEIDLLYDTIDLDAYEQSRVLYPQWTGRRDKRGIPLYVFVIRHLDSKTISTYEKAANKPCSRAKSDGKTPQKLIRLFALYENLTRFVMPLCTEMPDRDHAATTPITLSTNIVDVSGVSLRQFWNLKSHMQAASTLATAHYPETLDRIFILGAPMFFSTVWGWVKRWFDPVTVSKIFILSHSEVLPTLLNFIDIANIPKTYGGELDFEWGQMPNLDAEIRGRATWENSFSEFPNGPVYWRPTATDAVECIAVGSSAKDGDRNVRVCTLPRVFRGAAPAVPHEEMEAAAAAAVAEETPATNGHAKDTVTAEPPVEALKDLTVSEKAEEAAAAVPEATTKQA